MWQISVSIKSLGETQKNGHLQFTVTVPPASSCLVPNPAGSHFCRVVSTKVHPAQLVLVFRSRVGVRRAGKSVPCPILVFSHRGGIVTISRDHQRVSLRVAHCPVLLVSSEAVGSRQCAICHAQMDLQLGQQCPVCSTTFHLECNPVRADKRLCPSCGCPMPTAFEDSDQEQSRSDSRDTDALRSSGPRAHPSVKTVVVTGVGNIGSKVALQLPLLGIGRLVLVDPDRINVSRNGKCCPEFAANELEGKLKCSVIAAEIRRRCPDCTVVELPTLVKDLNRNDLGKFLPAILIGCVDSRAARLELARLAEQLDVPLIDLAIDNSPDRCSARVRTTWTSINGISQTGLWSVRDLQLMEEHVSCDADSRDLSRPVASVASGDLAAVLGLRQVKKLLAGDRSDIAWETRADLEAGTLVRSRLGPVDQQRPASPPQAEPMHGSPTGNTRNLGPVHLRRARRIERDEQELQALTEARQNLSFLRPAPNVVVLRFLQTPGLARFNDGVRISTAWEAVIVLPEAYPVEPPAILLSPADRRARTFHPNCKPNPPQFLCYGRHVSTLSLADLALRLEQIITLSQGAVMTKESDALDPIACQYVRALSREGKTPLTISTVLPQITGRRCSENTT